MQDFFNSLLDGLKENLLGLGIGTVIITAMILGVKNPDIIARLNQSTTSEETIKYKEVKLIVLGEDNQPVEKVQVQFILDSAPERRLTNSDGYAGINIPIRNDINVILSKEGFQTINTTINLQVDESRTRTYTLEKEKSSSSPRCNSS